ncbi:hypothetical protein P343_01560 [Sporolactobacillus laevolacticus DSM 442]|uniref:Uncharacterized protein n=1 Tax=Sporolactobacillus laevolacticus DSM 442 TaxID=1395513 RepID=V6J1M3_9BACL|nr:hypothetical protein P343_01560 [Sporolactobacillus laevolacticus DSM 442]
MDAYVKGAIKPFVYERNQFDLLDEGRIAD